MNNMGKVCEKTRQGLPVEAGALYIVTVIFYRQHIEQRTMKNLVAAAVNFSKLLILSILSR